VFQTGFFIDYYGNRLHYAKTGSGRTILLMFHGFGQHHGIFDSWAQALCNDYTLYSFDLFFHGQSHWQSRKALEKTGWQEIMTLFFKLESITDFELVGFSMGGKFALATLELFPTKVKKITLLAPDGIKTSFWYSLATYPIATRSLFKSMILHPKRLLWLTKFLRALHLVDDGLLRFAENQMNTEEKRRRVYYSWVYFRHLKFNLNTIATIINRYRIPITLLVGRYDKVIQPKKMRSFLKLIETKEFKILEAGHNDLIVKSAAEINCFF
ncbi:MAG: alpha/beta fold hydrolase, partial [Cytophagales bacterium]